MSNRIPVLIALLLCISCEKPAGGTEPEHDLQPGNITVHYLNAKNFEVRIKQVGSKPDLIHNFTRQFNTDTATYGEGQKKTLVTTDVWYPNSIRIDGQTESIQGNLNMIYLVDPTVPGFERETTHVGAGHGCELAREQHFYAGNLEIDPTKPFEDVICNSFKVTLLSDCYAVDDAQPGHKSDHAMPKLDADGERIIELTHSYEAEYRPDNTIEWDNKGVVRRNGIRFKQLHGAMCQGKAKYFNKATVDSSMEKCCKFHYDPDHHAVVSPVLPGGPNFSIDTYQTGSTITLWGKDITIEQTMTQTGSRAGRDNYLFFIFYRGSDTNELDRLKVYQMPVKTVYQFKEDAETFNDGDEINVHIVRKIEY